jgi:outer membrane scaffolding protein for murein synthesis (MipA/OmpV family)
MASARYFDAYYGVSASEARASGLAPYSPGGGVESVGLGGAITWNVTDRLTASTFAEYKRLLGPAADSSLVKQRGDRNQWLLGVSSTYRFDLTR